MPLCFALLLLLNQSASPSADLSAVTALLRAGNFSQALQQTSALLGQSPGNSQLWTLQGFAHTGLGQKSTAVIDYKHALSIAPDYIPALKAKAQIEYQENNPSGIPTLRHILKLQPSDQVSHAMLASLSFQQHDCRATVENYSFSQDLLATQPAALTQYGECLIREKRPQDAIGAFRQAASLQPDDWQPKYNLSFAEFTANHPHEALETLQPLLTLKQHHPQILTLASTLYEATGDTPHAVSILRQAIIDNSKDTKLYLQFADLSFVHRSFQVGIDMLNAGLTQLPESAALYVARGVLLVQLGRYDAAESDFAKADRLDPNQSFSSVAQSLTKLQENKLDQALSTTEAQIERAPRNAFLYYLKAETLRQKGATPPSPEFTEAIEAARHAIRLKPDYPLAEDLLGSLYLKQDKIMPARQQFETALKHDPTNESALYHMITVARKQHRTADIPALAKRLAEAKAAGKKRDDLAGQFVMVEPGKP